LDITEERDHTILRKSIQMLHEFLERVEYVNSGREYVTIHNRNVETIAKVASERNSEYLKTKLGEYPKISAEEVDDYIKTKKKEVGFAYMFFNVFGAFLVDRAIRMVRTKGSTPEMIKQKLEKINSINSEVFRVIENEYLETLYTQNKQ